MLRSRIFRLLSAIAPGMLLAATTAGAEPAHATLSLDGTWQIVFDHENEGREADWHEDAVFQELDARRDIAVPSAWELIEQDYEGVAFYRHEFDVPADWKDRVVRLQFGAVNYLSEVWLNGEAIGVNEGGFTPFEFRVDRLLKPGETNVLTLRVVGPILLSDKVVDGVGPLETPQWRGGITGGIWQSVQLVATGDVYVQDVYLRTSLTEETSHFQVTLDQTAVDNTAVEVQIEVAESRTPDSPVVSHRETVKVHPGVGTFDWELKMPAVRAWSPDDPFLYTARVRIVRDGEELDAWQHRFGFREFTVRDRDFHLNGEPFYLKATFFEGLYPNGIAAPDNEAMIRREIQLAKDAGFNMIRPWRRPPVPEWLDLADEMGVLVVGSPALECMRLPLSTPYLPARVEHEIREAVLRDRNRTSVVMWELFNELHRPILMQMMRPMALLTRDLDSTRLVLDESGGWAAGANLYLPDEYVAMKFNDIHYYAGPFVNEQRYDSFLVIGMTQEEREAFGYNGRVPGRNVVPGLMSFISELGYGSLPNLPAINARFQAEGNPLTPAYRYHERLAEEQPRMLEESGFAYLYADLEAWCLEQQRIHGKANRRLIEGARANPEIDGYCIHALTGGDWILGAGLLDLWREPKSYAYEGTKAANQPQIISIRVVPRNVYAEAGTKVSVIGINEHQDMGARLHVEVVDAAGASVMVRDVDVDYSRGVSDLFSEAVATASLDGTYTVNATLKDGQGKTVTENTFDFDVFPARDLAKPTAKIAVLDPVGRLKAFLHNQGIAFAEFSADTPVSVPVLVTDVRSESAEARPAFEALIPYIASGGTAVYIDGSGQPWGGRRGSNQIYSEFLPIYGEVNHAMGLWTAIPHLVREHPVFDGLPVDGPMDDIYGNVWAPVTLMGVGGEPIVASIGFAWFSQDHEMVYSGPGESYWGADMAEVRYGKGRCILSELKIVPNLGKDPVADRLLYNLIRFAAEEDR